MPEFNVSGHSCQRSTQGQGQTFRETLLVTMTLTLTQGHQFQKGPSQCGKQSFSDNLDQISTSIQLEFCSLTDRHTDRQTHTHTHTYIDTHTRTENTNILHTHHFDI